MIEKFLYLVKKENSLEQKYNIQELQSKIIIKDDSQKCYFVFDNIQEFTDWYQNLPVKCCHEVIFGNFHQRIRFDIDVKSDINREPIQLINTLIETILNELYFIYNPKDKIYPSRKCLGIFQSNNATKYSYHIVVIPYSVADCFEAHEFAKNVVEKMPQEYKSYIDLMVYKRIQNFRLMNSTKINENRPKVLTTKFQTSNDVSLIHSLIRVYSGTKLLSKLFSSPTVNRTTIIDIDVENILSKAKSVTKGHRFREIRENLLCFDRLEPTFCKICKEIHHHDNTLMLSVVDNKYVLEYCRHSESAGIKVCDLEMKSQVSWRDKIDNIRKKSRDDDTQFDSLPIEQQNIYNQSTMKDYELCSTLVVKSQMKLGKTKTLGKYLETHFPSKNQLVPPVIRMITFRQTFSLNMLKSFPNFSLYSKITKEINTIHYPRVIIQTESLYRLKYSIEPIDLLILDEVESILDQFNSGLFKYFNASFTMFQWMMKTAKYVICMDANVCDRTYYILRKFRPQFDIFFHKNTFQRAIEDKYYFTRDHESWIGLLHHKLSEGQKIVLTTSSLLEGQTCEYCLKTEFPDLKIVLYSSETLQSIKDEHFSDVHKYWLQVDVLIYTPTCSAGVSFELEHFDSCFGFFTSLSCPVETCRQMIGRVRNLRTKEHFICFSYQILNLPVRTEQIKQQLYGQRQDIWNCSDRFQFYSSNYFYLWLETTRLINLSKNNFPTRFITQIHQTGAGIDIIPYTFETLGGKLEEQYWKGEISRRKSVDISTSEEITSEEAFIIKEELRNQKDVEECRRFSYEKYKIRDFYTWWNKPISESFVYTYGSYKTKHIYTNLIELTQCATIEESIIEIRKKDAVQYKSTIDGRIKLNYSSDQDDFVGESYDLIRNNVLYSYHRHNLAIWILKVSGFQTIFDQQQISTDDLMQNLSKLEEKKSTLISVFEIPYPYDLSVFSNLIKFANHPISIMYGIKIRKVSRKLFYKLYIEPLFDFSDIQGADRPNINSKIICRINCTPSLVPEGTLEHS